MASLGKQVLVEALDLNDEKSSSSAWTKLIVSVSGELLKNGNIKMKLHILDKLAPKERKVEDGKP